MSAMLGERIVIANRLDELPRMSQWLHDGAASLGLEESAAFALDVCANEVVTNIISYAYHDQLRHDIALELQGAGNGVRLVIRDDGKPFNLLDAPEHKAPGTIEEAGIGGLGILLIRRMMSRCSYERADGFNVLYLEI